MTFGSLFAGIGGFDLGFHRAGLTCLWQVEKDPDCRRVLARHWPDAKRRKGVRGCNAGNLAPVDVICGGFPCQDLSVAGKRKGLAGKRSGLFYEMMRIVHELQPRFLVWENVPGLLTSDGGRDFTRVLVELERIGFHGAWTGLDARYFGLAQRRRRIFGVFARPGVGAGRCAEILSLAARRDRHPPKGREAEPGVAASVTPGARRASGQRPQENLVAGGQTARYGKGPDSDATDPLAYQCHGSNVGPMGTMRQGNGSTTGGVPFIVNAAESCAKKDHAREADVARCLDQTGGFAANQGGTVVAFAQNQRDELRDLGSLAGALAAQPGMKQQTFVAHTLKAEGHDASEDGTGRGVPLVVGALGNNKEKGGWRCGPDEAAADQAIIVTNDSSPQTATNVVPTLRVGTGLGIKGVFGPGVRRLTPVECCRLQGFPDDHLDLTPPLSDSAKYRTLGNAVAVPCAEWIGRRLTLHRGTE